MKRVYLNTELHVGQTTLLQDSAFHYLFRVLRCRSDEEIIVFNGDGQDYLGKLQQQSKKSATIFIHQANINEKESPLHTTLLQGLSKGERMEMAIQKAVELGVNEIYPLQTTFSAVKLSADRQNKKHRHWQAIIQSACEQCGRASLPILHPLQSLAEAVPKIDAQQKLVLHPYADKTNHEIYPTLSPTSADEQCVQRAAVLIGAEGGFSEAEIELAEQHGFNRLQLGQRILRTETATVSALTLLQFLWGDYAKSPR